MKTQKNLPKRLLIWAAIVAAVLTIPLVAKFPWDSTDYIAAGAILFGAASTYEIMTRNTGSVLSRRIIGVITIAAVILIWGIIVAN